MPGALDRYGAGSSALSEPMLRSYTPSLRERAAYWLNRTFFGDDRKGQERANVLMNALDLTPVGLATGMYDAGRELGQGNALGALATAALTAAPVPAKGTKKAVKDAIQTVFRGGKRPWDVEDAAEMIKWRDAIFAHQDRNIAGVYGSPGPMTIDTSRFLDASTPEGLELWKKINSRGLWREELEAAGYGGAIYPDPHDWSEDGLVPEGFEIAIIDPNSIIFD